MACPYTNKALQTMCKYEGVKCSGTKEELCERLLKHFQKLGENVNIDPKKFSPKKYYAGLSPAKAQKAEWCEKNRHENRTIPPLKPTEESKPGLPFTQMPSTPVSQKSRAYKAYPKLQESLWTFYKKYTTGVWPPGVRVIDRVQPDSNGRLQECILL